MKLKNLLKGLDADLRACLAGLDITGLSGDSRDTKKGHLFVAIEGFKVDGHKFVKEALKKGAAACLVNKSKSALFEKENIVGVKDTKTALAVAAKNFYHSPSEKLKVIGITGTNGKTTTSLLTESIFRASGIPCGIIGTIDYRIGARRIRAERTTPDVLSLNAFLDEMLKNKIKAAAIEVSSHALDQGRVQGILFEAAIFTNLSHEHLDYHGDLKRYFRSKMRIFENLKTRGTAIINFDDRRLKMGIGKIANRKILTYGISKNADISAEIEKVGSEGSFFTVKIRKDRAFRVGTKLVGAHNISNILAAVSAGVSCGLDLTSIKKGIERLSAIPGRLEPVKAGQKFKVFVDYAHTHEALENVLRFLKQIKERNIITVFGCGGERDAKKRPIMGQVAQKFSDTVIITNDNPRGEDPKRIARGIEKGMKRSRGNYAVVLDRKKAIESALKKASLGDIVLIAGKGHEKVQIIGRREIPFNDKRVAQCALKKSYKIRN